ncbi:integrase catalytic domain-containing protein [Trichonephila clavipes]|nr:integrase catalytic domain-containing protein [Trichonephila clavipes]
MDATKVNIPSNMDLADKDFGIPGEIDMLIGCELFFELLRPNKFRSPCEKWLFQETVFGYIVVGSFDKFEEKSYCGLAINAEINSDNLNQQLQAFWEIEKDPYCLGNSRFLAEVRLNQLWKKLSKHYELQTLYKSFVQEYIDLNHMQLVADPLETNISYFLPHHGVLRPDSKTTKLRVVFNASSKTTSSLSLNDILYKGEILQQDLFSILLRFRQHTFVFTTDISKMFRQILIIPGYRDLQMILWKDSVDGPVQTYKLNTVTYGTTCAPYLATRTIQQLARDEGEHYPLSASVTIRDIYMDDILTGSSDFQEFQKLQLELISLFKKAGMSLHKWCSNTPEILNSIPEEEKSWDFHCQSSDQKTIKTLGIIWSPQFDYFSFKTVVNCQTLGSQIREWDEPLSNPIAKEWNDFVSTLPVIQNIHVPRLVIGKGRIIIHGFADASTAAYGAVLYAQSISEKDVSTRLLCSKSRVAPVKPITIPRLELCYCHSFWKRFLHNSRNPSVKRSGQLDYSEVNEAELCLIKNLQASAFQEEIEFLAKSSCNSKKASKAVHLEIVSDLTTDAFIATLKRFVARRGKCVTISSDNAQNFVGANRELKRLHNLLKFPGEKLSYLSSEGISWNFMPPRAPNFGGLWEAGVK